MKILLKYKPNIEACTYEEFNIFNMAISRIYNIDEGDDEIELRHQFYHFFKILEQERIGVFESRSYPLIYGCIRYPWLMDFMVKKNINIAAIQEKKNLLHKIASKGTVEVLEYVLSLKTYDIVRKDYKGRTPLDVAREKNNIEVEQYLKQILENY